MANLIDRFQGWNDRTPEWADELRELTVDEVRDAIRFGTIANHRDVTGDLVEISWDEDYSGAFLDDPSPTARIDGDTLALVLRSYAGLSRGDTLGQDVHEFDPRGLRLRQVLVVAGASGTVNLGRLDLPFSIGFQGCIFDGWFNANQSELPGLSFDTCLFVGRDPSLLLDKARIDGDLRFFNCEGLRQFFAPGATLGSFDIRSDGILLPPGGRSEFRTVLSGARIGCLILDGDADPHKVMPAGACAGLGVDQISLGSSDAGRTLDPSWKAEWVAKWLSGGTPPSRWRPLGSWGPGATHPHHRTAWWTLSEAMSRAGYESLSPRGLAYLDQGMQLRLLAERHRDSKLTFLPRFLRWLSLDVGVGYFTANVRALRWLVCVWLVVSVLAWLSIHDLWRGPDWSGGASGAPDGPLEAGISGVGWAFAYGLNFVVSPLDLGFGTVWPTSIGLLVAFAALKLLAIGLFGLFIVGISGIVSRTSSNR